MSLIRGLHPPKRSTEDGEFPEEHMAISSSRTVAQPEFSTIGWIAALTAAAIWRFKREEF